MNKITTLYPTLNNELQQTPIPIESIFYLEEARRDNYRPNRFYFNFPESWATADKGESIIGVRNIYINARRRKLDFTLYIRKYYRDDFNKIKNENPKLSNDEVYNKISSNRKSIISCKITSWLGVEHDLREIFNDTNEIVSNCFKEYNKKIEKQNNEELEKLQQVRDKIEEKQKEHEILLNKINELKDIVVNLEYEFENTINPIIKLELKNEIDLKKLEIREDLRELKILDDEIKNLKQQEIQLRTNPEFEQEQIDNRDIQMDGYYDYDKKTFIETIYSPKNIDTHISNNIDEQLENKSFYIDFKIEFTPRPIVNGKQNNSPNSIYDFADVFNIGKEAFQNDVDKYMLKYKKEDGSEEYVGKWQRQLTFENVWDRHSAKIYSSFATDNSKGYLGNSQIFYHTIKYFKLNSTDQQFWIEFYSARHSEIPLVLPINESFNLEIQFLHYHKLLYI